MKFNVKQGNITDEKTKSLMAELLETLVVWTGRLQQPKTF